MTEFEDQAEQFALQEEQLKQHLKAVQQYQERVAAAYDNAVKDSPERERIYSARQKLLDYISAGAWMLESKSLIDLVELNKYLDNIPIVEGIE